MPKPKIVQILQMFGPAILSMVQPKLAPVAAGVAAAMAAVEAEGLSGPEKAEQVANIAISTINNQAGHIVVDPSLSRPAIKEAIATTVTIANLVKNTPPK
jgi:hypothetical protein